MKTFVRIGAMVIALSLAALFAGCASYSSVGRSYVRDFEVVETSARRRLTAAEMAYLRAKVQDYLVQQGQTGSGDYYLKVYLAAESAAEDGEWVIVRYSRYPAATYNVVSTYPTYSYPSYGYSTFDYQPFGFFGLSALSFRYYDYPYYGGYGYYPRYRDPTWTVGRWYDRRRWPDRHRHDNRDRPRDREGDQDRDRDRDRDDDRRPGDRRPSGALKPSFVPANVGRAPWQGPAGPAIAEPTLPAPRPVVRPGATGTTRWSTLRPDRRAPTPRPAYTPPTVEPRSSTAPAYRPPTRSNLHRQPVDVGSARSSGAGFRPPTVQPSRPERTYTPPSRSEPRSAPHYEAPRHQQSNPPPSRAGSGSSTRVRNDGEARGRRSEVDP